MKKEIAIIGFGRIGRLLARELSRDYAVVAADRRRVRAPGVRQVSVRQAAAAHTIILAVPAGRLRSLLAEIAPFVRPGTLVMDVCAVKEEPIRWMRELLPRSADILGLHPLFGPDSAARGVRGHTIVLCPARISPRRLAKVTRYLGARGLVVRRTTAPGHDRAMARTLFVTQFIGRALANVVPEDAALSTPNARLLASIIRSSLHDAPELFRDIYRYNRYARRAAPSVVRRCERLLERLALSK